MKIWEMTSISRRFNPNVRWSGYSGKRTPAKLWKFFIAHTPDFIARDLYNGLVVSRKVVEVV